MFEEFPKPQKQAWLDKLQAEASKNSRSVESLSYQPLAGLHYELLYDQQSSLAFPPLCGEVLFEQAWEGPSGSQNQHIWCNSQRYPQRIESYQTVSLAVSSVAQAQRICDEYAPDQRSKVLFELPCGSVGGAGLPQGAKWGWSTVAWCDEGASARTELAGLLAGWVLELEGGRKPPTCWTSAVGTLLLLELSKFRAAHLLWDRLQQIYQVKLPQPQAQPQPQPQLEIRVAQSGFYWSGLDREVNLLRSACAIFVANLSGAVSVRVHSFEQHPQAQHWAHNQNRLMRHEGRFAQQADPLSGCYAVESLAEQLARQVWQLAQSNLSKEANLNWVAELVQNDRDSYLERLDRDQAVLVGTSRYAPLQGDPQEFSVDHRASSGFEDLRRLWKGQKVGLWIRGDRAKLNARIGFIRSFLALAGIEAFECQAVPESAALVALCCADGDIEDLLREALAHRKPGQVLLVAGPMLSPSDDRVTNVTIKSGRLTLWRQLTAWLNTGVEGSL